MPIFNPYNRTKLKVSMLLLVVALLLLPVTYTSAQKTTIKKDSVIDVSTTSTTRGELKKATSRKILSLRTATMSMTSMGIDRVTGKKTRFSRTAIRLSGRAL